MTALTPGTDPTSPLIYDSVDERRLALLRNTVCKGATDSEIATFLELAARYSLDPLAREIWCAVSQRDGGKRSILLMVGRDGLRRVAMRQGMIIDGDVVHEADEFTVRRLPDGTREITHVYGHKDRGPIVGAFAEVYTPVKSLRTRYDTPASGPRQQRGYFYAAMSEYRPKSEAKLKYSPWGAQESVMILAAAERTALSMATPLAGLVAEGELDRGDEMAQLVSGEPEEPQLAPPLEALIARATLIGHAQLSDRASVNMMTSGLDGDELAQWYREQDAVLDLAEAAQAETVDGTTEDET